jgi:hypothetical protein
VLTRLISLTGLYFVKIDERARVVAELKRESTHAQRASQPASPEPIYGTIERLGASIDIEI